MEAEDGLAARVRGFLAGLTPFEERRMMGARVFLIGGHMACGVSGDGLMLRLGSHVRAEVLHLPHVAPMRIGGREMRAFVRVAPAGLAEDGALEDWIGRALAFVATLPPKV